MTEYFGHEKVETIELGDWDIRINGERYNHAYREMNIEDDIGSIGEMRLRLEGISEDDENISTENSMVISINGQDIFDGEITKIDYSSSDLQADVHAYSPEYKLKKRNITGEWIEESTQDIVSEIVGDTMAIGENVELESDADFRSGDESKLKALNRLCDEYGGEWYIDKNGGEFQINVVNEVISDVVKKEFVVEDDLISINTTEDDYDKYDKVVVLGFADGENQIRGSATVSSPPDDPEVRKFTNKNILSESEANSYAEQVLDLMKDGMVYIEFKPQEIDAYSLGDKINLEYDDLDFDGDYRIVGYRYKSHYIDGESLLLRCSHRDIDFLDRFEESKDQISSETDVKQGSNNVDTFRGEGLCDNDNKAKLTFRIPDEIDRINSVELSITRPPVVFETGDDAGEHLHPQNFFSQEEHGHFQNFFSQEEHGHFQNFFSQLEHGHAQTLFSQEEHKHDVDDVTETETTAQGSTEDYGNMFFGKDVGSSWKYVTGATVPSNPDVIIMSIWPGDVTDDVIGEDNLMFRLDCTNTVFGHPIHTNCFYEDRRDNLGSGDSAMFGLTIDASRLPEGESVELYLYTDSTFSQDWTGWIWIKSYEEHKHEIETQTSGPSYAEFDEAKETDDDEVEFDDAGETDGGEVVFDDAGETDDTAVEVERGRYSISEEEEEIFYDLDGVNIGSLESFDVGDESEVIDLTEEVQEPGSYELEIYPGENIVDIEANVKVRGHINR